VGPATGNPLLVHSLLSESGSKLILLPWRTPIPTLKPALGFVLLVKPNVDIGLNESDF
jgi:hypothetical protein